MQIAISTNPPIAEGVVLPQGWELLPPGTAEVEIVPVATKAVTGKAIAAKPGMAKVVASTPTTAKVIATKSAGTIWTGKGLSLGLGLGLGAWGPVLVAGTAAGLLFYFKPELMKKTKNQMQGLINRVTG